MCPEQSQLCGVFMFSHVPCSQDAPDAALSTRLAATEGGGSAPGSSPAPHGYREVSLVIKDLWLVAGCLFSPPPAFWGRCPCGFGGLFCAEFTEYIHVGAFLSMPHSMNRKAIPGCQGKGGKKDQPQALTLGHGNAGLP